MALTYPKQSDIYDVDVFNDNFRELDKKIEDNNTIMTNNIALKASKIDVESDIEDIRDVMAAETDSLSERITAETEARINYDNKLENGIKGLINKIYVKADDTPEVFINSISTDYNMLYSNITSALSNAYEGCDIVLLPGSHDLNVQLDLEGKRNITVRGVGESYRDNCVINYNGGLTTAIVLHGSENITLKDFRLNALSAKSSCISGIELKNTFLSNLYIYGGGLGVSCVGTSGYSNTIKNMDIINCIFKQTEENGTYGKRNIYITGHSEGESIVRLMGNIAINETNSLYYLVNRSQILNITGNMNASEL